MTARTSNTATPPVCPVVVVGASAGGLDAFRRFLGALPEHVPVAFVLVQHLDPSRASHLAELLKPSTGLPVVRARNNAKLRAGTVLVVPEGRIATIEHGVLQLRPRGEECHGPIDMLFSSIASQGAGVCGVVLSGQGSDGAQGLAAIAAAGGVTFAQDPKTSEYGSMPEAAIAADVVDFVGSPEEIAGQIAGVTSSARFGKPVAGPESDEDGAALRAILEIVHRELAIDFSRYKRATVRRRVDRRMMSCGVGTLADYLAVLERDPAEASALVSDLLINVTQFFRDPAMFEALAARVFPEMLADKSGRDAVRIWVPGCSTGEEVYSLLIALEEAMEGLPDRPTVIVFGTDLSEAAIDVARAGIYSSGACDGISPERRARFFHRVGDGYQIHESLRASCVFARQDITRDTPFSRLDLISLRNVLIYMEQELQRRVLSVAHYALVPEGFLVLGTSETPDTQSGLFTVFDKQQHIYRRKDAATRLPLDVTGTPRFGSEALAGTGVLAVSEGFNLAEVADQVARDQFLPPRVVVDVDDRVVHFFGDASAFLELTDGRATLDLLDMASASIAIELREAIEESRATGRPSRRSAVFPSGGRARSVAIEVSLLPSPAGQAYRMVAFLELPVAESQIGSDGEIVRLYEEREDRLSKELGTLRGRLRGSDDEKERVNQALRAANEEARSSNEELQSINEELETAKEELQSANEELITVNDELRERNLDLAVANDDISNFIASTVIPVIMLDCALRVRRYTPQAVRIVNVVPTDIGRPFLDLRMRVNVPDLAELAHGVIDHQVVKEREVRDQDGHWYSMQLRPYLSAGDRIEGAVLSFIDIDDLKSAMQRVETRAQLADALTGIDAALTSTIDVGEIMQRAVDEGVRALAVDAGTIELRDVGAWVISYQHGFRKRDVGQRLSDADAPNATEAERRRVPFAIEDMAADERTNVGFVRAHHLRSVIAVPLLVRDAVIGCLLFYCTTRPRAFGRAELEFAGRLGASVSLSLENARLFEAEMHATRTAETLVKINEILLSALTVDDLLARLVGEVSEAAGADKCLVIDVRDGGFAITHVRNLPRSLVGSAKGAAFYPMFALTASEKRPILVGDAVGDPRTNKEFVVPNGLAAFQLLPISVDGEVSQVLALAYSEPRAFDDEDRRSAERMADAMSVALRNARLYEAEKAAQLQAQQELEFTQTLLDASAVLAQWTDLGPMLDKLAVVLMRAAAHSRVTIGLWDEDRGEHTIVVSKGDDPLPPSVLRLDEMSPSARKMITTRKPVIIDYSKIRGEGSELRGLVTERNLRYALSVPIVAHGRVVATITVDAPGQHKKFSDREVAIVQSIADHAAVAIENARLVDAEKAELERTTLMKEMAQTASRSLVPAGVCARAMDRLSLLPEFAAAGVWVLDSAGPVPVLKNLAIAGYPDEVRAQVLELAIADDNNPGRLALHDLDILTHEDEGEPEEAEDRLARMGLPDVRWMTLPIKAGRRLIAVMDLIFKGKRSFSESEIGLFSGIAATLGPPIRNAQLFAALSQTSERLSDVLDSMTDGFVSVDRDWVYTLANPRALEMLGKPAEDVIGKSMAELYPDMFGWPQYRRVMRKRKPEMFDVWSKPLQRWLEVRAYPTADGLSIMFADISERKAAEQALAESRTRADQLALMLDGSSQPFGVGGLHGELLLFNRAFADLTGYSGEELKSIDWAAQLTPPEYREMEADRLAGLERTGQPVRYEKEYIRKDGTRVPIELLVGMLHDAAGAPESYYSFVTDLTQRKAAEAALLLSESRFRVLFETMEEGFSLDEIICDGEGRPVDFRYLDVNPAFERQTGLKSEDIVGRTVKELFPGTEDIWLERYGKVALTGVPDHFEAQFGPLDRWFDVSAYRTGPNRFAVVFFDMTERKKAQDALRQRTSLLEGVNSILDQALRSRSEQELGEACLAIAQGVTDSAFGFIGELGEDGVFNDVSVSDPGWDACFMYDQEGHRRAPGRFDLHGIYGRVLQDGTGFYTNDPASHPDSIGVPEGHPTLTAFLGVPLLSGGRVLGMVALANRPGGYRDEDLRMVEALAPAMVEALERKRAEEELARAIQRLDAHINNSPLAVIEFDADFRVMRWSDEAERMFGWQAEEVLGKAIGEFRWVYEEDTSLVDEESGRLSAGTGRSVNVNRNYRKDGSVIWCEWYDSAIYDAGGTMVSTLAQALDITARREAEAVRERLIREIDAERARLREIIEDIPIGVALLDGTGTVLEANAANGRVWAGRLPGAEPLSRYASHRAYKHGTKKTMRPQDWPGSRAIKTGDRTETIVDVERLDGTMGMVRVDAIPIKDDQGAVARVVVIAEDVTDEVERAQFNQALSEIGSAISATLDFDEILDRMLSASAKALHVDSAGLSLKRGDRWEIMRFVGRPRKDVASALSDHQLQMAVLAATEHVPIVINDVRSDPRVDPALMESLGIRSLMALPIIVRNAVVGVVLFHHRLETRAFTPIQVDFSTRLMSVVALALENARQYETEHDIADRLQEALLLLPEELPGIEFAHEYHSATESTRVGGDFYDIFELDEDHVGITIGDVAGKGIDAAVLTSIAKHTIRAYAVEPGRTPGCVLSLTNNVVYRATPVESFLTVFFGILDRRDGALVYASASHTIGAITKGDGTIVKLGPTGTLLGAFDGIQFKQAEVLLERDEILFLYTDGLTESRSEGELYGDQRLFALLATMGESSTSEVVRAVVRDVISFAQNHLRDDLAILAVRRRDDGPGASA